MIFDVIVIGGGPAGLSAALLLGRCLRRVLVLDSGQYRNGKTRAMHGYLGHDGVAPRDFLARGRSEVARYGVAVKPGKVLQARRANGGFQVYLNDGEVVQARKLLLATGVEDVLPAIPGLATAWGRSAFACPFCDGYENRNKTIAVLGHDAAKLALVLRNWSPAVSLLSNGQPVPREDEELLRRANMPLIRAPILRLVEHEGQLQAAQFAGGERRPLQALFVKRGLRQRSDLALQLGLQVDHEAGIHMNEDGSTNVPGVFVAGDASRDHLFAIVAAAEGVAAGQAIHLELDQDDGRVPA